jgi:N-acetylmuramoyl-L-alanine amidase
MGYLGRARLLFAMVIAVVLVCAAFETAMATDEAEHAYRQAELSYDRLSNDPEKQKDRDYWLLCIDGFKSAYAAQPDGPWADDALFMVGKLYGSLFRQSSKIYDKQEAVDYYTRLLRRFPGSPFSSETRKGIAELDQAPSMDGSEPDPGMVPVKKGVVKNHDLLTAQIERTGADTGKESGTGLPQMTDLRVWSSPDYTRVVVDVEKEVGYSYRLLKKDPSIGKPQRLYVDLDGTRMGKGVQPVVPIGDGLLSDARAAQYTPDTVRIVVDIKSIDTFKIFSLNNPFRVVVDVNGISRKQPSKMASAEPGAGSGATTLPAGSLAKQLALGVRRVVIDPGHGGKDPGAIGYSRRTLEKNVTLAVAKRLAKKVEERLGLEAVLTRKSDVYLALEERTAIANTRSGDIFISIHANASRNRRSRGVETYFLNLATDEDAILVAARENATSTKNISDLESILSDLMKNAKINESSRLAGHVQKSMAGQLKKKYGDVIDKGVKQAPFYVLLGAEMPSVLVETSFISNPTECERLSTARYQDTLADAIVDGIETYIRDINPMALKRPGKDLQAHR